MKVTPEFWERAARHGNNAQTIAEAGIALANRTTVQAPDVERITGNGTLAAKTDKRLDPPCRIHVHSIRKRLADADGVSGKAAIDGLVLGGVLEDDSTEFVKEVSYSQEKAGKGEDERTIIEIWRA